MRSKLRRTVHALLFTLAALGTLFVLFYAEENWRGERAWVATKRDLRARGESLDLKDFIPPPVPDDQNLAMAPLFVRAYQYKLDPKTRQLTFDHDSRWSLNDTFKALNVMPWGQQRIESPVPALNGNWTTGHRMDLPRLQAYYRQRKEFALPPPPQSPADDVLLALTHFKPLLDELAQAAAERPETRFPYNWTQQPPWSIALPAYNTVQLSTTTLRMRAVAELAAGQTAAARRDTVLMLHLRRAMEHDPSLIAPLVDATCIGTLTQSIWEGMAARQWSADDLDALRDGLHGIDMLKEFQQAIRGERAFFIAQWPTVLQEPAQARELAKVWPQMNTNQESSFYSTEYWLWKSLPSWPRGWFAENATVGSRYLQEYGVETVDPANHRVALTKIKSIDEALRQIPHGPQTMLARISLPVYAGLARKFAQTQTSVDQAMIACALEKYFLDHRAYPAALATLVPGSLDRVPNDVIDGAPMRYGLTVDGRYKLWSVGWDGKDDGGAIGWPQDRTWRRDAAATQKLPNPDPDQGDWVWQYAPAEPPDPPANLSRLESREGS